MAIASPWERSLAVITLMAVSVMLFGACDSYMHSPIISVENKTSDVLTISIADDSGGTVVLLQALYPGRAGPALADGQLGPNSTLAKDGCTIADFVAVDPQGHEVARRRPPVCDGETWVIEMPNPSGS